MRPDDLATMARSAGLTPSQIDEVQEYYLRRWLATRCQSADRRRHDTPLMKQSLRAWRQQQHLLLKDLARASKLSMEHIQKLETGHRPLLEETRVHLAKALRVQPQQILSESPSP